MGGGHDFHLLHADPSIEKWAAMRENVYTTFKFTPKTTRIAVTLGLVIPGLMYFGVADQHNKWDLLGRTKTESLQSGLSKPGTAGSLNAESQAAGDDE